MKQETEPTAREIRIALTLSALGRNADANQALEVFVEEYYGASALAIADDYAWRGDADRAFTWLDTTYQQRDAYLAEEAYRQ